jgi:hypothetical protein
MDETWEIWFQTWPGDYDEAVRARIEDQLRRADRNGHTAFDEVEVNAQGAEGHVSLQARVVWSDENAFEAFDFPRYIIEAVLHDSGSGEDWCAQFRVRHFDFVLDDREREQALAAARRDF